MFKFDIFFVDKDGYEGHLSAEAGDLADLTQDIQGTKAYLALTAATPRYVRSNTVTPNVDTMVRAAEASGIATPECPEGHGPMRFRPAGISQRTQRPYKAFYSCAQCQSKVNS